MQNPPQAILFQGVFPDTLISKYLTQAARLKIPVVSVTTGETSVQAALQGPVKACLSCQPFFALSGKLMAAIVAANAGAATDVAYVEDPTLTAIHPLTAAFDKNLNSWDPGSTVGVVQVSQVAPATQTASTIVSYVQSNPTVKYVVFELSSLATGVPQALASAGLAQRVKIIDNPAQLTDVADIRAGTEFASIGSEDPSAVWRGVDALASILQGVRVKPSLASTPGWKQIIDKSTVSSIKASGGYVAVPGFPATFLRAWHVAGASH